MKPYLLSAAVGLLVGVIYALFNVRSPAPPVIALIGLLGILVGEQLPPLARQWFGQSGHTSWLHQQVRPHMFGELPRCAEPQHTATTTSSTANPQVPHG